MEKKKRIALLALTVTFLIFGTKGRAAVSINPGDILVVDAFSGLVIRIDPLTGESTAIEGASGFTDQASGIALDGSGSILVVDGDGGSEFFFGIGGAIFKIDPVSGVYSVSSDGFLLDPFGIAIDANGDIFVAGGVLSDGVIGGGVVRVDPVTGVQTLVSFGDFLDNSPGIAIDENGDLLIVDPAGLDGVLGVNPITGAQTIVSSGGILSSPVGIVLDENGDILVADLDAGIIRVDPATGNQTIVSTGGYIEELWSIALDENGDILVADGNAGGLGFGGIIRVNPLTGVQTILASVENLDPRGLAVVPGPAVIQIQIDIKPGSFPNSINLGSGGNVPVAVFSTPSFDAGTIDPTTVRLASAPAQLKGKGTLMVSYDDVDGDGRLDLVIHVSTNALLLSETDTEAILEGWTFAGQFVRGADVVRVVP